MKMEIDQSKIYGIQQNQFPEAIHSDKGLPQDTRKILNKQPNFISQGTRGKKNEAFYYFLSLFSLWNHYNANVILLNFVP